MTTRKGRFIFCIQIIVVLTKYTAGFQNETTDDSITKPNSNNEFVWESMNLDEIQNFRYYDTKIKFLNCVVIDECEAGHLLNEEFEDQCDGYIFYCNHRVHWRDIYLLEKYLSERKVSGFEDVSRKTWFDIIYESVARYLINEEFEHPYSLLTYEFVWESMNLDEFQNFRCYAIYESEAGYFIYQEFEHPYSSLINKFVWESMNLDEIQNFRYYEESNSSISPRRSLSERFDEEAIDESEAIHLLKEELEDQYSWLISINESEAIHLLNEEFEDLYSRLISINESEAGHIINEEFEDPYNWFISIYKSDINEEFEYPYSLLTYCNHSYHCIDVFLLKACLSERKVSGFEDVSRKIWFDTINESEAGHLLNKEFEDLYSWLIYTTEIVCESMNLDELQPVRYYPIYKSDINRKFEDPYSWIIYCNHRVHWRDIYLLEKYLSERKVSGFEDVSRKTWFEKLNYQTSMESLHGIESTALLATFILTVLSMRIVSEEQRIKDTVSHSLIVKTTTKEARQNLPTKAEEEAVRHCELCINHDQAIAYCMTCKLYICMPCNGLHKRVWTLMNHTVCPFNHM